MTDKVVDRRHTHILFIITGIFSPKREPYSLNVNSPSGKILFKNSAVMGHNINTIIDTTAIV